MSLIVVASTHAQSLTWLGMHPSGSFSFATGVSADGAIVSGMSYLPDSNLYVAFRWTQADGLQSFERSDGPTYAHSIASNVDTIVGGVAFPDAVARALYWSSGSEQTLPADGDYSMAFDISSDGGIIVGVATTDTGAVRAVRWDADGIADLGTLSGRDSSAAYGVSGDGAVVVGESSGSGYNPTAVYWNGTGIQPIATPSNWASSVAVRASSDGGIIIGNAETDDGRRVAFRWTTTDGVQDIGTLGGAIAIAYDISDDGSIIVGFSYDTNDAGNAFRWTSGGMENLNTTYAYLLTNNSVLIEARAISADGRYIAGMGFNGATGRTEAFLLDTACTGHNGDVDANGCVDDADLLAVLFAFGSSGSNLGRVDVNCDETVDDADLLQVLFNFGSGC
ncbi:MAG: hypothetical protein WHS44_05310 [Fimbriimonadales bacterium]